MKKHTAIRFASILLALFMLAVMPLQVCAASQNFVTKITVKEKGESAFTIEGTYNKSQRFLKYKSSAGRFTEVGLPYLAASGASKQNRIVCNAMGDPVSFAAADLVLSEKIDQVTYVLGNKNVNYYFDLGSNGKVAEITNDTATLYAFTYDSKGNITEICDEREECVYTFDSNGNMTGKWNADKTRRMANSALTYTAKFDSSGRLTRWIDGGTITSSFSYNSKGILTSVSERGDDYSMDYTYSWASV